MKFHIENTAVLQKTCLGFRHRRGLRFHHQLSEQGQREHGANQVILWAPSFSDQAMKSFRKKKCEIIKKNLWCARKEPWQASLEPSDEIFWPADDVDSYRALAYQTLFFSRSSPLPVVGLYPAVSVVKRYQISRENREELLDITGQRDPSLFHLFAFDNPQKMSHVWPESEVIDEPRISANYQRFWLTINSFRSSGNNDSKSPIIGGARFDFLE